jgi:hypothetical protein
MTKVTYTARYKLSDGREVEMPGPSGEGWIKEEDKSTFGIIGIVFFIKHNEGLCWLHDMKRLISWRSDEVELIAAYKWTYTPPETEWYDAYRNYPLLMGKEKYIKEKAEEIKKRISDSVFEMILSGYPSKTRAENFGSPLLIEEPDLSIDKRCVQVTKADFEVSETIQSSVSSSVSKLKEAGIIKYEEEHREHINCRCHTAKVEDNEAKITNVPGKMIALWHDLVNKAIECFEKECEITVSDWNIDDCYADIWYLIVGIEVDAHLEEYTLAIDPLSDDIFKDTIYQDLCKKWRQAHPEPAKNETPTDFGGDWNPNLRESTMKAMERFEKDADLKVRNWYLKRIQGKTRWNLVFMVGENEKYTVKFDLSTIPDSFLDDFVYSSLIDFWNWELAKNKIQRAPEPKGLYYKNLVGQSIMRFERETGREVSRWDLDRDPFDWTFRFTVKDRDYLSPFKVLDYSAEEFKDIIYYTLINTFPITEEAKQKNSK